MEPKRPLSVDGVRRRQAAEAKPPYTGPGSAAAIAHHPSRPLVRQRPFQEAPSSRRRFTFGQNLQLVLLITGGMVAGFLVESLAIGLTLIGLYAIIALVRRVPSRVSFMLSFISMVTVILLLIAKPGSTLAGNFATYTFLLLVTGVIALAIEAHPPKRRKRAKRPIRG